MEDVNKLVDTIQENDNPFLDTGSELVNLYSKKIMSESAVKTMKNAFKLGQMQYEIFWKERLKGTSLCRILYQKTTYSFSMKTVTKKG